MFILTMKYQSSSESPFILTDSEERISHGLLLQGKKQDMQTRRINATAVSAVLFTF